MGSLPRMPSYGSKLNVQSSPRLASAAPHVRRGSQFKLAAASSAVNSPSGAVLVFGEALFDCLANQKGVPREKVESWCAPRAKILGIKELYSLRRTFNPWRRTPYPGGAPANVAAALGKLGAKVAFITAFGNDDLAKKMKRLLLDRGVDLSAVQHVDSPTRDVLVIFDDSGDREFIGFGSAEADQFADCFISADKLPEEAIKGAQFLVTGTLGLAYPETAEAMRKAVQLAKQGPCSVLIDVNWRPVFFEEEKKAKNIIFPYVEQGDVLKMSDEEAEWLYGIPRDTALHNPQTVLEKAASAKGVLVTAGQLGCAFAFRKAGGGLLSGYLPVLSVEVEDTTGAGDAFLAGFLFAMIEAGGLEALQRDGDKLKAAVDFATACGAFTTTQPGGIDAQPSKEQAEGLLKKTPHADGIK